MAAGAGLPPLNVSTVHYHPPRTVWRHEVERRLANSGHGGEFGVRKILGDLGRMLPSFVVYAEEGAGAGVDKENVVSSVPDERVKLASTDAAPVLCLAAPDIDYEESAASEEGGSEDDIDLPGSGVLPLKDRSTVDLDRILKPHSGTLC